MSSTTASSTRGRPSCVCTATPRGRTCGASCSRRPVSIRTSSRSITSTWVFRNAPEHSDDCNSASTTSARSREQLDLRGPVVVVAHDWGGPISLGWIAAHRDQVAGIALTNTAVHQPAGSPAPALIRFARLNPVRGACASRRPPSSKARCASRGLRSRSRCATPTTRRIDPPRVASPSAHSSRTSRSRTRTRAIPRCERIVASLPELAGVPTLLLWGPSDPVFSDLYLRDLQDRFPHADVHRFVGASHLVAEDADVAGAVLAWMAHQKRACSREHIRPRARAGVGRARPPRRRPRRRDDRARRRWGTAVVDVRRARCRRAPRRRRSLRHRRPEGRSGRALVPPGLDLTACLYACWRIGAVVVFVDAGLGVRGISNALKSATPAYIIGIPRALAAGAVHCGGPDSASPRCRCLQAAACARRRRDAR